MPRTGGSRLSGLDGLRGVAALVVLIHHAFLTVPELSKANYLRAGPIEDFSSAWFVAYTPVHLLWAGQEAVSLFFVLSGLVLVRQVQQGRGFSWRTYFPRRLVRLYLPVLAAVVLGYLSIVLVTHTNDDSFSAWLNARPNTFGFTDSCRTSPWCPASRTGSATSGRCDGR